MFLSATIIVLTVGCQQDSCVAETKNDVFRSAEQIGFEYHQLILYSLNNLFSTDQMDASIEEQNGIVERAVNEWIIFNGYEKGSLIYNAILEANVAGILPLKSDSELFLSNFTSSQVEIIEKIFAIAKNSMVKTFRQNIAEVEQYIQKLPVEEQFELYVIIEIIKGACDAISVFENTLLQNYPKSFGTFMCNLLSGGIGTIYGAAAGGIASGIFGATAIATGGVSVAVGLITSSILGTLVC